MLALAIRERSLPSEALPDRRVLYVALALVSATLFGAAAFSAGRLPAPARGATEDDWWQRKPRPGAGRAGRWSRRRPLLGLVAYMLTHDFRTLLAPFIGLLLFANYRPRRLTER